MCFLLSSLPRVKKPVINYVRDAMNDYCRQMPKLGQGKAKRPRSMVQAGFRLWNISLVILLVLTFCNILLTIRLLHFECPRQILTQETVTALPRPLTAAPPQVAPLCVGDGQKGCKSAHQGTGAGVRVGVADPSSEFRLDPRLGRWDKLHLYKLFDAVVVGERFAEVSEEYSVCLATQSSLEKLHSLVEVTHHWTGPISVALFAAGDGEIHLLKGYVSYLRRCYPPIRERVTFHMAFSKDKVPSIVSGSEDTTQYDCNHPEVTLRLLANKRSPATVRWRTRNPYPQNHLRNLARKNCQGKYVFMTDVDIVPSSGMAKELDTFMEKAHCKGLCAYVIPTFELDERVRFPRNKTDLVRLVGKGLARPFHQKVFIFNQFATNSSRWIKDIGSNEIHVSHNVTNYEFLYEPFYVASDTVPPHDERFIGYGFTRNSQVYEMHVAGYQFQVLSPVFNCHWGLQVRKSRPSWREAQNNQNRRHFDAFKREIYARYNKPYPSVAKPKPKPPKVEDDKKEKKNR
ncbi:beta-1,4-glucuronyltransferase 1 isoform X2 [Nilaparvata lugens]|uniref:beta-1,4-glucuronyltransferase 1 isoform X2 n=1 Tax=Nilaparvata lugens TaxID=108931 RepID=UPI00193D0B54|nr:beta-1,4-glucuronyltransferase 1 isoform X2 [Nilaparvata lugens]